MTNDGPPAFWRGSGVLTAAECEELVQAAEFGIYRDDVVRETWRAEAWTLTPWPAAAEVVVGLAAAANSEFWHLPCDLFDVELKRYDTGHRHPPHRDAGTPDRCQVQMSVQLSDPDSYTGGDLLVSSGDDWVPGYRDRGAAAVFPASAWHQVTEITSGHRWALIVTAMEARVEAMSVYLRGSLARGEARPDSDCDVLVVGPGASCLSKDKLDGLLADAGVDQLSAGRRLDLVVGEKGELADHPIHVTCIRTGRHLHGPALDLPLPDSEAYAQAASVFAEELHARGDHQDAARWEEHAARARSGEHLDSIAKHPSWPS